MPQGQSENLTASGQYKYSVKVSDLYDFFFFFLPKLQRKYQKPEYRVNIPDFFPIVKKLQENQETISTQCTNFDKIFSQKPPPPLSKVTGKKVVDDTRGGGGNTGYRKTNKINTFPGYARNLKVVCNLRVQK